MDNKGLPFGTQFTPSQISIMPLLKIINENNGKPSNELISDIEKHFFSNNAKNSRKRLAQNCKQSLVSYGILEEGGGTEITDFGKKLIALTDENAVYEEIGEHLLKNKNGMMLIEAIRSLKRSGVPIKNETVIKQVNYLLESNMIGSANNVESAKLWLNKAKILNGWEIDELKVQRIIGMSEFEVDLLRRLTTEQYYFFRALCNLNTSNFIKGSEVRALAEATYGVEISPKQIAPSVIIPLEQKNLIKCKKTTSGRGGASHEVKVPRDVLMKITEPVLNQIEQLLGKDLLEYYQKTLKQIKEDMSSRDKYTKGLALEALAIRIMQSIGLSFHSTRLRGTQTGGAEIDALFESSHLHFSRWQVQCKNIKKDSSVKLDQIAKEVGLYHTLLSNVIVVITTGQISKCARGYADDIMKRLNLCIILVDGSDLDKIIDNPVSVIDIFNRESLKAKNLKVISKEAIEIQVEE